MLRALLFAAALCLCLPASNALAQQSELQTLLQSHQADVAKPSRSSVDAVLADLAASNLPGVATFLEKWQSKDVWVRESDGVFFFGRETKDGIELTSIATGEVVATVGKKEASQIKPNGGVRKQLGTALVQFQLSDPDITRRTAAVDAIAKSPAADQLEPLLAAIEDEPDAALKARKTRLAGLLGARFADDEAERIAAIEALSGELSLDVRAVMNQLLTTQSKVATALPDDVNIAHVYNVGDDLTADAAYAQLVAANLAPAKISEAEIKTALVANVANGSAGGIPTGQLGDIAKRLTAYDALAAAGTVPARVTDADVQSALTTHVFFDVYDEPSAAITAAALEARTEIRQRVAFNQAGDFALDALSLASIYFLAAIGLAITFGVMGVINMAHGEFIMMGAYTGYVVQQFIPDYTISILVALPLAFAVTFGAGVAMERLVIRWLYHRPLETLLATFGISIALQQLAKNIFGTQARPLTSPAWLDGALVFNDVVSISYIRIAIFVLAVIFLGLILFILKKTRLGLEVRAVTQNPGMAASMGINPDRINMLTFGLGSGIAGIAGVAIGLYAKVTSEMGADYIVQSFMTVVVGGVGNVWGTLAGATMIGTLQKGIEWLNPSNTLAAQTYMILFIILFIQFRPKGIVALKGRAAGD
ncbi:urea ABC transporter permease subunit UrtB [Pseudoprimorskyibacter insulae]|uniref:High-affinity branched-chain amino acid transport system permease protein LivH n=1 Tax=Pseudoprimorskyibacter insulae TaxID=1695997 RepID=A0A2R8AQX8_9RHOB|nr:urea ABC transporter permease subunit UrtB [Pseudoprimorskyibacter insulae]SPF78239.1 High-affinity branched-chain amino acid transport system permease protein LivH [Pseudoprimorskyibacter insulae]